MKILEIYLTDLKELCIKRYIEDLEKEPNESTPINSFIWVKTSEGHHFWLTVDSFIEYKIDKKLLKEIIHACKKSAIS